jgi:hypothetical protein
MLVVSTRAALGKVGLMVALVAATHAVAEDVPYVATPDETVAVMLTMAGVGPEDNVIDLGSGDGRIVISAVKDFGARHALGIDINPRLVAEARTAAARAEVADRAEFRTENLFETDFSAATVLTMYLLPDLNLRLRPKVLAMRPGTRVVSHEFDMGDWTPDARRTVFGNEHPRGPSVVHLWVVPARVGGAWTSEEAGRTVSLVVAQHYQRIGVRFDDRLEAISATLSGDRIRIVARPRSVAGASEAGQADIVYDGQVDGDSIDGAVSGPGARSVSWRATRRAARGR